MAANFARLPALLKKTSQRRDVGLAFVVRTNCGYAHTLYSSVQQQPRAYDKAPCGAVFFENVGHAPAANAASTHFRRMLRNSFGPEINLYLAISHLRAVYCFPADFAFSPSANSLRMASETVGIGV
jgi:hypothetical protein